VAWVATLQDFFMHGLPPAACVPEVRRVQSVDFPSGFFELAQHGFQGGEIVRLRASGVGSALPTGASSLTYYTVNTPPGPDFFTLSGLTITDNGTGVITVLENPNPWILAMLAACSSYVVASHKSTQGPWTTPPGWAARVACHLAAPDVATRLRTVSDKDDGEYMKALRARAAVAETFLSKLDKGEPYSDGVGPVDATPMVAEMGPVVFQLESRHFLGREHDQDRA
jgi:hypothetical protein